MDKPEKSRNLPISEYYTILQQEFISYFIRSKIYPEPYADKYRDYCVKKKDKIEKIGLKNSLPSVFSSVTIREKYLKRFFNKKGLPNFEYRDDESVRIMGYWDRVYWFSKGTPIRIDLGGEPFSSEVKLNVPKQELLKVVIDNLEVEFKYSEISRLITNSLIDFS